MQKKSRTSILKCLLCGILCTGFINTLFFTWYKPTGWWTSWQGAPIEPVLSVEKFERGISVKPAVPVVSSTSVFSAKPSVGKDATTASKKSIGIQPDKPIRSDVFLVIGVPTKQRQKASYLTQTLKQLLVGLDDDDKKEVIVVVLITDFEASAISSVQNEIYRRFPSEIASGLLHVTNAPRSFYPNLDNLPPLWGDKPKRIRWRSKQCLDYAYLFSYSKDLGKYYLQIEDDVLTRMGYLKNIKSFALANQERSWSVLEFGTSGFIGMMYRASELGRLSTFVKMYHWVLPVDFLFRQFNDFHLYGNPSWARYKPPLFLHIGIFSSLDGQIRALEDINNSERIYKDSNNPAAEVSTSLLDFTNNNISAVYGTLQHGMFWGKSVKRGDFILVRFLTPVQVSRLIVESGGSVAPEDYFGGARVSYSKGDLKGQCQHFIVWQDFKDRGQIKLQSNSNQGTLCRCLKIEITELRKDKNGKTRWLAIREIAVWTIS